VTLLELAFSVYWLTRASITVGLLVEDFMFLYVSKFLPHFAGLKLQFEKFRFLCALRELIGSWGGSLFQG
jgi:hypothetical protein